MRHHVWLTAVTCLMLLAIPCSRARAEVTDDDIQKAIDRGVAYLFTQQRDNGWFSAGWFGYGPNPPEANRMPGGIEAMAMLGLTFAPVSIKDERMLKGFDALLKIEMRDLYCIAPRVMIICRLLNKLDRERRELAVVVLKKDLEWIQKAQNNIGAWGYGEHTHDTYGWDLSNTQMAVLALNEADMAGIELTPDCYLKVQKLYLDRQRPDGGWNYGMRGGFQDRRDPNPDDPEIVPYVNGPYPNGSYGSMTAAAVATLFITRDFLYRGVGCPCRNERSGRRPKKLDDAIDRGLAWLAKNFRADKHPFGSTNWNLYWLYSCERVGLAAGVKYFGTHDWYREGAERVVDTQRNDGSWRSVINTSYAVCFLAKGRAPILVNKLKHKGEWNNHPRDIANLAQYVGNRKEQPFNWQVINLDAPVAEWHDAPVLYITAETPMELADEDKRKLRRYTDTGGTILFEASCGNRKMGSWWRSLVKELWPEWELKRLPREHPVFASDTKMGRIPSIFGLEDGIRTPMFVSTTDISCPWNTMAVARRRELFDFGTNLYVYASDRRPLRARLASTRKVQKESYTGTTVVPGKRPRLKLARVTHSGDWFTGKHYSGPGVLARQLVAGDASEARIDALRREAELPAGAPGATPTGQLMLETVAEIPPDALDPAQVQIAYLAGRQGIGLSDAAATAVKTYLAGGGFLLAEAILGDRRADASFRELAARLGLKMRLLKKSHPLITGQMDGATGYPIENVHFRHALKAERVGRPEAELYGLMLGQELVGVYSPFDLMYCQAGYDAWECRGYATEDALAILTNIVLLVTTR